MDMKQNPFNFKNNAGNNLNQQRPLPLEASNSKGSNSNFPQPNTGISDWKFTLNNYKILVNSSDLEVEDALGSSDTRVKLAAIFVSGEKNLNVNSKLFDLICDEDKTIQQAARKALSVKSYYLIKDLKDLIKDLKEKKSVDANKKMQSKIVVNPSSLKIGIDYVDFGPLPYDSNDLINHAMVRWQAWFSIRENEIKGMKVK